MKRLNVGSLFTGIGGFDLGFEGTGFKIAWQVEHDKFCNELLQAKWPGVKRYGDIRELAKETPEAVDLVCGGDPCPSRSNAKGNSPSAHPDLAGYFLAVVGRLQPRWVVRENVPAPDAIDFAAGLETLGYRVVAFELDARDFTSQSRRRHIFVGSSGERATRFKRALLDAQDGAGIGTSSPQETTPIAACVTAHPARMAAEDSYCWEPCTDAVLLKCQPPSGQETGNYLYQGGRLRVLTPEECEGLQGFPRGWTTGFSRSRRRAMLGNAIPVPFAEFVGRLIKEIE